MIPEYEESVHVRIPIKHREQIEALIKAGKFKNLSQVVREALKQFLEKQDGEAKA
jgi:Arc/MetJ-type ribon-helix-helix transcriptional regulator